MYNFYQILYLIPYPIPTHLFHRRRKYYKIHPIWASMRLLVRNDDGATRGGGRGENLVVLVNVHDGRTSGVNSGTVGESSSTSDGEVATKVGEVKKAATTREILHNPLSVGLAEAGSLAREGVRDGLAVRLVSDSSSTASQAIGSNSSGNGVTGVDGNTAVPVLLSGREPLVPSSVGDLAVLDAYVDTSLQNGGATCVAVNTNPGSSAVLLGAVTTIWNSDGRNNEGSGN